VGGGWGGGGGGGGGGGERPGYHSAREPKKAPDWELLKNFIWEENLSAAELNAV